MKRLARPVEDGTELEQIALDRQQSGASPVFGLVRPKSDNPARRTGERAIERFHFANTATGRPGFARIVKAVDAMLLDQGFERFLLRVERANAPSIAAFRLRPQFVRLGEESAGVEGYDVDVDVSLGEEMEDDLILQSKTCGETSSPSISFRNLSRGSTGDRSVKMALRRADCSSNMWLPAIRPR